MAIHDSVESLWFGCRCAWCQECQGCCRIVRLVRSIVVDLCWPLDFSWFATSNFLMCASRRFMRPFGYSMDFTVWEDDTCRSPTGIAFVSQCLTRIFWIRSAHNNIMMNIGQFLMYLLFFNKSADLYSGPSCAKHPPVFATKQGVPVASAALPTGKFLSARDNKSPGFVMFVVWCCMVH